MLHSFVLVSERIRANSAKRSVNLRDQILTNSGKRPFGHLPILAISEQKHSANFHSGQLMDADVKDRAAEIFQVNLDFLKDRLPALHRCMAAQHVHLFTGAIYDVQTSSSRLF
jgi:hypothetical protein